MNRTTLWPACCLVLAFLGGCGPLSRPMVPRPDAEGQKKIDESWERALAPVGRLDHQALLDVFVTSQAYELGVDRLTFRSEKRFSGGKVVMEVVYDREEPAKDRFSVTVHGPTGELLREERYGREEVEQTCRELAEQLPPPKVSEQEPPERARRRAALEARMKRVDAIFPKPDRDKREKK